jgi:hypothetical protein
MRVALVHERVELARKETGPVNDVVNKISRGVW